MYKTFCNQKMSTVKIWKDVCFLLLLFISLVFYNDCVILIIQKFE